MILAVFGAFVASAAPAVAVKNLRTEYRANPMGLDCAAPRLARQLDGDRRGLKQHAYQVLVATAPALLHAGKGDLWDSGNVESDDSAHVVYA